MIGEVLFLFSVSVSVGLTFANRINQQQRRQQQQQQQKNTTTQLQLQKKKKYVYNSDDADILFARRLAKLEALPEEDVVSAVFVASRFIMGYIPNCGNILIGVDPTDSKQFIFYTNNAHYTYRDLLHLSARFCCTFQHRNPFVINYANGHRDNTFRRAGSFHDIASVFFSAGKQPAKTSLSKLTYRQFKDLHNSRK